MALARFHPVCSRGVKLSADRTVSTIDDGRSGIVVSDQPIVAGEQFCVSLITNATLRDKRPCLNIGITNVPTHKLPELIHGTVADNCKLYYVQTLGGDRFINFELIKSDANIRNHFRQNRDLSNEDVIIIKLNEDRSLSLCLDGVWIHKVFEDLPEGNTRVYICTEHAGIRTIQDNVLCQSESLIKTEISVDNVTTIEVLDALCQSEHNLSGNNDYRCVRAVHVINELIMFYKRRQHYCGPRPKKMIVNYIDIASELAEYVKYAVVSPEPQIISMEALLAHMRSCFANNFMATNLVGKAVAALRVAVVTAFENKIKGSPPTTRIPTKNTKVSMVTITESRKRKLPEEDTAPAGGSRTIRSRKISRDTDTGQGKNDVRLKHTESTPNMCEDAPPVPLKSIIKKKNLPSKKYGDNGVKAREKITWKSVLAASEIPEEPENRETKTDHNPVTSGPMLNSTTGIKCPPSTCRPIFPDKLPSGQTEASRLVEIKDGKALSEFSDNEEKSELKYDSKDWLYAQHDPSTRILTITTTCPYQAVCRRFLRSMEIPDGYLDQKYDRCYCEKCMKRNLTSSYHKIGKPPALHATPVGWMKAGIRIMPPAKKSKVCKKWHLGYHGTRAENLDRILRSREILGHDGSSRINSSRSKSSDSREHSTTCIDMVSPTIKYAGLGKFARIKRWEDTTTGKFYFARIVIQLGIKPGTYRVGPETVLPPNMRELEIDPRIRNTDLEWLTTHRGTTVPVGIMIRLDSTERGC